METKHRQFSQVYEQVRQIPHGHVATYGQIAFMLGWQFGARTVGWALRALPAGSDVPWHRVVNAKGGISLHDGTRQRQLLEAEGVEFDDTGKIDLARFGWRGPLYPEADSGGIRSNGEKAHDRND